MQHCLTNTVAHSVEQACIDAFIIIVVINKDETKGAKNVDNNQTKHCCHQ